MSMKTTLKLFLGLLLISSVAKAQPVITDPFFDEVDYIGAFGATDWTSGWCEWNPGEVVYPATTVTVNAGNITSNTTWTSGNTYLLNGWVYVKSGSTLTIEPGTIIRGDYVNKGSLIIEKGARLMAQGTSTNPIIFTSNEDPGNRDYGDWGGVILCGKATINQVGDSAEIEGGVGSVYGGGSAPDDADNSGTLEYVRIEFAGVPYVTDKEINGLTMGGVGSGTSIHHIQVSYSGDDAYEWFGGKVNCKYLVSFRTWDDDFDTDNGYQGMVQYAVSLRDPNIADPGSKSNGFESDNDKDGTTNVPQTAPVFSNVSMFGPKALTSTSVNSNYKTALHLRRNSSLNIYNSFFAGYTNGLLLEGALCEANATSGDLNMKFCSMAGIPGSEFQLGTGSTYDLSNWYFNSMDCNDTLFSNSELMITDGFNLSAPDFRPVPGSPLLDRPWLDCAASVSEENQNVQLVNIYPNPAGSNASLDFNLLESGTLTIDILDITGRHMVTVYSGSTNKGFQHIEFSSENLSEGLNLIRITEANSTSLHKLFVVH